MKLILNPYQDPGKDIDFDQQTPIIENQITGMLNEYSENIDYSLNECNFGGGADFPTMVIELASVAGVAFIAIPEAHKKVREALEEWKLINENTKKLINWVSGKSNVVSQPIEVLFIAASEALLKFIEKDDALFIKYCELSPIGSIDHLSGLFEFSFLSDDENWKVVINGQATISAIEKV